MSQLTLFLMSVAVAMDAFAVSVSNGVCAGGCQRKSRVFMTAFGCSALFAFAQGAMPCFGWMAGQAFASAIVQFDHWIALILLGGLGVKMIAEAFDQTPEQRQRGSLTIKTVLVQAFATSIDALAVGVGLAAINVSILYASTMIAFVTFVLCFTGALFGSRFGRLLKDKAEIFGGVMLILIGLKIFTEHVLS